MLTAWNVWHDRMTYRRENSRSALFCAKCPYLRLPEGCIWRYVPDHWSPQYVGLSVSRVLWWHWLGYLFAFFHRCYSAVESRRSCSPRISSIHDHSRSCQFLASRSYEHRGRVHENEMRSRIISWGHNRHWHRFLLDRRNRTVVSSVWTESVLT